MKTVILDTIDIKAEFTFVIYKKLVTVCITMNGYMIYINQSLQIDERCYNMQVSRLGAIQLIDKHIEELFNLEENGKDNNTLQ